VAAPRIQRDSVTDGNALISGFQPENARILAAILNSGPLPLPLAQSPP
jgi:preprotein translocase subunit SecD